jgi:hypothetical protein
MLAWLGDMRIATVFMSASVASERIAAWLSFAFIGAYELLMSQVRHSAWLPARLS